MEREIISVGCGCEEGGVGQRHALFYMDNADRVSEVGWVITRGCEVKVKRNAVQIDSISDKINRVRGETLAGGQCPRCEEGGTSSDHFEEKPAWLTQRPIDLSEKHRSPATTIE